MVTFLTRPKFLHCHQCQLHWSLEVRQFMEHFAIVFNGVVLNLFSSFFFLRRVSDFVMQARDLTLVAASFFQLAEEGGVSIFLCSQDFLN